MKYILSITALLVVVLLIVLNIRSCSKHSYSAIQAQLLRIDTIRITLPAPPPVRDTVQGDTIVLYKENVEKDSALLVRAREIEHKYDSLKAVLSQYAERVSFTTDGIIAATGDTIHIECNELRRSIIYGVRYAPRQIQIQRVDIPVQPSPLRHGFGLGACLGAGVNTDGTIRLSLTVGLLYGYYIE